MYDRRRAAFRMLCMAAVLLLAVLATACAPEHPSVFHTERTVYMSSSSGYSSSPSRVAEPVPSVSRVPWDYRIVEGTVGDLIGSDMTVLPDNQMLPNDDNYATGDKIWTLQFMDAELTTDANERNSLRLSSWSAIKSYKKETDAKQDMEALKVRVTTEVNLVGVYKTEYQGKTRSFAILELPSGNQIKQPIDDARYAELEKQKTVMVQLEEVHDFADYDLAFAKFRGWAK